MIRFGSARHSLETYWWLGGARTRRIRRALSLISPSAQSGIEEDPPAGAKEKKQDCTISELERVHFHVEQQGFCLKSRTMLSKDGLWGGPEEVAHSGLIRFIPKHAKDKEEGNEQTLLRRKCSPNKNNQNSGISGSRRQDVFRLGSIHRPSQN